MDPFSAFGLAANILAFVEFSGKLVASSRAIYKSAAGASDNACALEFIALQITQRCSQIPSQFPEGDELKPICDKCRRVGDDLLVAVRNLMIRGRNRIWESFKVALRETWNQSQIDSLEGILQLLQQELIAQMQTLMRNEQSSVNQEILRMGHLNEKLDMETNRRLASLETNVRQVLNALGSEPRILYEQTEILANSVSNYHKEARVTAWNQRLIESLYYPRFQSRQDAITTAHSTTFEWIMEDTPAEEEVPRKYVEWLRTRNGTYFVQGKAGSGKSTLMKFLWQHHSTEEHLKVWSGEQKLIRASYFFWAAGDELQKSEEGLMRALLFEILRGDPQLIVGIRKDLKDSATLAEQAQAQTWTRPTLLKVFEVLMDQKLDAKFCFFIDGLDEYRGNTRELIKLVQKLVSYPNIKICVSSRPEAEFRHAFGEGDNVDWHIKLEDLTSTDICRQLQGSDSGYSDIAEQVTLRAQGVFLWVFLVVRSLLDGATHDDRIADMRRRLDALPDDLDDFFRDMLDRVPKAYRAQSAMTFTVAIAAARPLPLWKPPTKLLEYPAMTEMISKFPNRLDARCKGLLEIVKRKDGPNPYHQWDVDFLHRTVRDFLNSAQEITRSFDKDLAEDFDPHVLLCHAYLENLKRTWPTEGKESAIAPIEDLMHYATQVQNSHGNTRVLEKVFDEATKVFSGEGIHKSGMLFDAAAIQFGLQSYVTDQLFSTKQDKQEIKERATILLGYALFCQRLERFRGDEYGDHSINPTIVNCLLEHGADPNGRSQKKDTHTSWGSFVSQCTQRNASDTRFAVINDLMAHGADMGYEVKEGIPAGKLLHSCYPKDYEVWAPKKPWRRAVERLSFWGLIRRSSQREKRTSVQ
ncbi:hypothetical protein PG995_013050 [Apiospora arundinis]